MKGQVAAVIVGFAITAFASDSFYPHQQGEVTDYWDTSAYVAAVPATASASPADGLYAERLDEPTPTPSLIERAFKTSGIAELAIRIKRYAAQGLSIILR